MYLIAMGFVQNILIKRILHSMKDRPKTCMIKNVIPTLAELHIKGTKVTCVESINKMRKYFSLKDMLDSNVL